MCSKVAFGRQAKKMAVFTGHFLLDGE